MEGHISGNHDRRGSIIWGQACRCWAQRHYQHGEGHNDGDLAGNKAWRARQVVFALLLADHKIVRSMVVPYKRMC